MMSKTMLPMLFIAGCGLSVPVLAQTQSAMNASASRQAKAADGALNAQYRATMAALSPAARPLLRDAQRSWITFRDQECKFEASAAQGGSAYPLAVATCLKRLSDDRTRQLRTKARCQEGDISCTR